MNHKWENCFTIDKYSWGFRRNAKLQDFMSIEEILQTITESVRYKFYQFFHQKVKIL